MAVDVPDDVLHLVCQQLFEARDFPTLANCALASKRLAVPAIMELYRMYEVAPITNRGRDESLQATPSALAAKWAILWRSIILSCIGGTLFPYASYLRVLDLKDLVYLFDDGQFAAKILKNFFADISTAVGAVGPTGPARYVKRGWNIQASAQQIGDLITQNAPLVEELDGNLDRAALVSWIPRLRKLTSLRLWNGSALAGCGELLARDCPGFRSVEFYHWSDVQSDAADASFAEFLSELREQSLVGLQVISRATFGPLTFGALSGRHGKVLTALNLNDLPAAAIQELGELKGCTALRSLTMSEERPATDLEQIKGVYEEVLEWLRSCKNLKSLHLERFLSGAAILTPLFHEESLELEELVLMGYSHSSAAAFYESLHTQTGSLTELLLQSEAEEGREQIDSIVLSISQLRRLKSLRLKEISDPFQEGDTIVLASSLRQLESLWLSGWTVTDEVLRALAGLHSLKRLDMFAFSQFSYKGLLNFISQLGPGNTGLNIGISMATPYQALSEEEQEVVRQAIREKVDGRFEYTLFRDPEAEAEAGYSESESD